MNLFPPEPLPVEKLAEVLEAHQLKPHTVKTGETYWICVECTITYNAAEARHGVAQCAHQADVISGLCGYTGDTEQ